MIFVPMYIETAPNRNLRPAILFHQGWREGKRVRKKTLANLTEARLDVVVVASTVLDRLRLKSSACTMSTGRQWPRLRSGGLGEVSPPHLPALHLQSSLPREYA